MVFVRDVQRKCIRNSTRTSNSVKKIEKRIHLYYTTPMIRKSKHYFNTSGPNKPEKHYTLKREYLIKKGKKQVAYYAKSISVDECVYLVFVSNIYRELGMKDEVLVIDGVTVRCYVIFYDELKDF